LVADDPDSPSPYWLDNVRNCGPRCLHYLDRHFGGSRSLKEICKLCPPLRDGSPLADVARAARELGWGVTPFTCRSWDLTRLEGPAILHMLGPPKQNVAESWMDKHFVVLLGYDPGRGEYLIYDPPKEARYVERRYVSRRFSGVGLLIDPHQPRQLSGALAARPPWPPVAFVVGLAVAVGGPRLWRRGRKGV
jgi:ABC-type bacteriocin/lantibiotic exporter with double-glycine peptidase domain